MTVQGDPAPVAQLPLFLDGWKLREIRPGAVPDIEIAAQGGRFTVTARGATTMCDGVLDAANTLAGAAIAVHVASDPDLVCLHAGAVEMPSGVVALVGDTGAGKSSLSLMLAAKGYRLFGDDRIALRTPAAAIALGLAPKMRWPPPQSGGEEFARYLEARASWWGETAFFLRMRDGESAPFGVRAKLAAVVVLDRNGAAESLAPLGAADAVRLLVPHCFAPHVPGERLVRALNGLAQKVPISRLIFSDSAAAAALLQTRHG